jgi:hypothetical protein
VGPEREEKINRYKVLVVKPEGQKPLGKPRRKWEDHIKTAPNWKGAWPGFSWLRSGIIDGLL